MIVNFRDVGIFQCFTESEQAEIKSLGSAQAYSPNTNIVIEGEQSGGLYMVLEGMLGVYKTHKPSGTMLDVGNLKAGEFFGEISLLDQNPRAATVKTLTKAKLFCIPRESFLKWIEQNPKTKIKFLESCLRDFILRLKKLDEDYVQNQYQLWKSSLKKREIA